ncbi:PQQ-binding-like beta-propeller repeat protein [Nonomuraea terrae]|uniref:outer membrane protein assembly factor BamB family protein n=1 Tax=Nonomuraea terrae TaxID=2530383 RepID=UPI0037A2B420
MTPSWWTRPVIGRALWERPLHQSGSISAVAATADRVVVHERHTRLACLSRHDGSLCWDVPVGTWPRAVVAAGDRCMVLPQNADHLSCLDLATGAVMWRAPLRPYTGHVVVSGETVVVGGWRGYTPLAAFDLNDGRPLWRTPHRKAAVLPLPWNDGVLVGSGPEVRLVDPRDGRELLRWRLPEPVPDHEAAFTMIDAGRCLVRCGPRSVVCVRPSAEDADRVFRHDADLLPEAAEFRGGVLWLREPGTRYLAVDPETGSVLWRVDVGQPFARGVVHDGDGFVLAGQGGMLFRLGRGGHIIERAWASVPRVTGLLDLGTGDALMATEATLRMVALAHAGEGDVADA